MAPGRGKLMTGCTTWMRIGDAIERLQAKVPAEGEAVH